MEKNIQNIQLPSNRRFGLFFSIIFIVISFYFFFIEKLNIGIIFLIISILFFLISIFVPKSLYVLNLLWMRIGIIIGIIVNPVIVGLIYFLLFFPIGLIMKLYGRDELLINLKNKKTFWYYKNRDRENLSSFKNQF